MAASHLQPRRLYWPLRCEETFAWTACTWECSGNISTIFRIIKHSSSVREEGGRWVTSPRLQNAVALVMLHRFRFITTDVMETIGCVQTAVSAHAQEACRGFPSPVIGLATRRRAIHATNRSEWHKLQPTMLLPSSAGDNQRHTAWTASSQTLLSSF